MAQRLDEGLARIREALLDEGSLVRAVASGRRRGLPAPSCRRVEMRYVDLKAGRRLQLTSYDERQAHTRNVEPGGAASTAVDEQLSEPFGNWHVETTGEAIQLRVTKKGAVSMHTRRRESTKAPPRDHDRAKRRLLDPGDPVLRLVGITDHRGSVKPSRQAKFRQVEEFLRDLDATLDAAVAAGALPALDPEGPTLRVVDLGCGNAYLTFAAFAYLQGVRGLPVEMVGIDVKPQSRDRNTEIADELAWSGLTFVEGAIASAVVEAAPDVVLALHACDTATDEALARALAWQAPVVLAAPCCHHDVQRQLRRATTPAPFGVVTQHGILRERMADVLTDALRSALLRQHGYRVDVIEFVDSKHTPRNVLIRAIRTGAPPSDEARREYDDLVTTWGVRPALARMLES